MVAWLLFNTQLFQLCCAFIVHVQRTVHIHSLIFQFRSEMKRGILPTQKDKCKQFSLVCTMYKVCILQYQSILKIYVEVKWENGIKKTRNIIFFFIYSADVNTETELRILYCLHLQLYVTIHLAPMFLFLFYSSIQICCNHVFCWLRVQVCAEFHFVAQMKLNIIRGIDKKYTRI